MLIRLDWATFNFSSQSMNMRKVSKSLLGHDADLRFVPKGKNDSFQVSPYGLSWLDDCGYDIRPHRLQVSGLGCSNFALTLPQLVLDCNNNGGEVSFSRLDFAFDVLMPEDRWSNFLVNAFDSSLHSNRSYKAYSLAGSGSAMTVYIGSRTSPRFFRIYNKSQQDKHYQFLDDDGNIADVPDGYCVIRYEVELKRKLWNRDGKKVVVDPSPLFYDYYSGEDSLVDYIRNLWLSFGDDVILPDDFATAPLVLLSKVKILLKNISRQAACEVTEEEVYKRPYSFEHVLDYVVTRFGKYIPFIVASPTDYLICEDACRAYIGFVPDVDPDRFIKTNFEEESDDIVLPWESEVIPCNQIGFDINNFDESEVLT